MEIWVFLLLLFCRWKVSAANNASCTFDDQTTCGWTQNERKIWVLWGSDDDIESNGPDGPVGAQGSFVYVPWRSGNNSNYGQTVANLTSPILSLDNPLCMNFYYHLFGAHTGQLKLFIISPESGQTALKWTKQGTNIDAWRKVQLTITSISKNIMLRFVAEPGNKYAGDIALDEIDFDDKACPPEETCDFETDFCLWTAGTNNGYAWQRITNKMRDHTTGSQYGYYIQPQGEVATEGAKALLQSPQYDEAFGSHCLVFWYYTTGDNSSLDVVRVFGSSVEPKSLWSHDGWEESQWHRGQVEIPRNEEYKIAFQATKGKPNSESVALDDVTVSADSCALEGTCSFNYDMCGYANDVRETSDFRWLLGTGRVINHHFLSKSPPKPLDGMYLYVDLTSGTLTAGEQANLASEVFEKTPNRCLSFHFYIYREIADDGAMFLLKRDFSGEGGQNDYVLWTEHSGMGTGTWMHHSLNVTSDQKFQIIFRVVMGEKYNTFVAIDNVDFSTEACTGSTIPIPITTENPVTVDYDNDTFACDFETPICNWDIPDEWQFNQDGNLTVGLPKYDKSKGNYKGKYIFVSGKQKNQTSVTSPDTPSEWTDFCVQFWYFGTPGTDGSLSVKLKSNEQNQWTRTTFPLDWAHGQLHAKTKQSESVSLVVRNLTKRSIALDDISITEGRCPNLKLCSFEDDWCGYRQHINNDKEWKRTSGNELALQLNDHSNQAVVGKFLYADLKELSENRIRAVSRILTPSHLPTDGACVTFWYYYSANTGTISHLNVYLSTLRQLHDPIWSISGNQGPLWYPARVTINSPLNTWQVAFEALTEKNVTGFIMLDDVEVADKICPTSLCTFEDNNCLWQNVRNISVPEIQHIPKPFIRLQHSSANWEIVQAFGTKLKIDVTEGNGEGNFLQFDSKGLTEGETAVYVSERYPYDGTKKCLQLWYMIPRPGENMTLQIYDSSTFGYLHPVNVTDIKPFELKWTKISVDVTPKGPRESPLSPDTTVADFSLYLVGRAGTDRNILAVDDITVKDGPCTTKTQLFGCIDGTHIFADLVCNFQNDCFWGDDEVNCGPCTFEKDMCDWSSPRGWARSPAYKLYEFDNDHTLGNSSGHVAHTNNPGFKASINTLVSPRIGSTSATCRVSFWYNSYDTRGAYPFNLRMSLNKEINFTIWAENSKMRPGVWQHESVILGKYDAPLQLMFESISTDREWKRVIAVDDIDMLDCGIAEKKKDCGTDFQCNNKVCISKSLLCNFEDDCGDNSDESECREYINRCNFDKSFCDWSDMLSNGHWVRRSGFEDIEEGPTRDHTKRTPRGSFLYLGNKEQLKISTARLSGPILRRGENCSLRFFYLKTGRQLYDLRIKTRNYNNGPEKIVWHTSDGSHPNTFIYGEVTFSELMNYQVIIEAQLDPQSESPSYIAVDDVSFSSNCVQDADDLPEAPPTQNPPKCDAKTQFTCKSGKCINLESVCNFEYDCRDNDNDDISDESNCGTCSFDEGSMCGWESSKSAQYEWTLVKANEFATKNTESNVPVKDALSNSGGGLIVAQPDKHNSVSQGQAILLSPRFQNVAESCKIHFYYHAMPNAKLLLLNSMYTYWSSSYDNNAQKGQWLKKILSVGNELSFERLTFQAEMLKSKPNSDVAIDNINFVECGETTQGQTMDCTFETDDCAWYNRHGGWLIRNSRYYNSHAVDPPTDHTRELNGHYLLLHPYVFGKSSMISSIQKTSESGICFTFWYYMFGLRPPELSLYIYTKSTNVTKLLWKRNTPQVNKWLPGYVTVTSDESFQVIIEGHRYRNDHGSAAVDDIKILDGRCPQIQQKACDFELDTCGWQLKNWILVNALEQVPQTDHTTGSYLGKYLKLPAGSGTITSPNYTRTNEAHCLKFWYFVDGDGKLQAAVGNEETPFQIKWGSVTTGRKGWQREDVTLDLDKNQFQAQIIGNLSTGNLAIDDVAVDDGPCEPPGHCNFETDMCTWTDTSIMYPNGLKWLRNSGNTARNYLAPLVDHTTMTSDGWYIFVPMFDTYRRQAKLESEILHYSPKACFSFWYHAYGLGFGKIEVNVLDAKTQSNRTIWNTSTSNVNEWLLFQQLVEGLPNIYSFEIVGTAGYEWNSAGDISIDDIEINPDTCDQTKNTTEPTDNSTSKWDCNFEGGTCFWDMGPSWSVKAAMENLWTNKEPTVDHTSNSPYGKFASFSYSKETPSDTMKSTQIDTLVKNYCFEFWHYLSSPFPASLQVDLDQGGVVLGPVWSKRSAEGSEWRHASYNLKSGPPSTTIVFRAEAKGPSVIAVDDLTVREGLCKTRKNSVCEFESTDLCGFHVRSPDVTQWERRSAKDIKTGSHPDKDHTYGTNEGSFMIVQSFEAVQRKSIAHLIMPNLEASAENSCLRLWYHTNGIVELNIYVRPSSGGELILPIKKTKGEQNGVWQILQATITAQYPHEIVFEAVIWYSDSNHVAIDDVVLLEGSCPPPGSCNFERDLCGFSNNEKLDLEWVRYRGLSPAERTGPTADHTLGNIEGYYIYLQGGLEKNLAGQLQSETLSVSAHRCLTFWAHMYGSEMGTLSVGMSAFSGGSTDFNSMWDRTGNHGNSWFEVHKNIVSEVDEYYKIAFTGRTKGNLSTMALDDISLSEGLCYEPRDEKFYCDDKTEIPISAVCDFNTDCNGTASDEAKCGSCDFEHGKCGWTSNAQWGTLLWNHVEPGVDSKLPKDKDNTTSGRYMLARNEYSYNQFNAILSSPDDLYQFKQAAAGCLIKFWYYFSQDQYSYSGSTTLSVLKVANAATGHIWQVKNSPKRWMEGTALVGYMNQKFSLQFLRQNSYNNNPQVGLDDITFENCGRLPAEESCPERFQCNVTKACIGKDQVCDLTDDCSDGSDEDPVICQNQILEPCTFENGYGLWNISRTVQSTLTWSISNSRGKYRPSANSGPLNDHTHGYDSMGKFLLLKPNSENHFGKKAWFVSPNLHSNSSCSLRFYYYMYGNETNTLNVYLLNTAGIRNYHEPNWTRSGSLGQYWDRAVIQNRDSRPFQIYIEGLTGNSKDSEIAIDDISFSQGCNLFYFELRPSPPNIINPCSELQFMCDDAKQCIDKENECDFTIDCKDGSDEKKCGTCDFENGMCGWKDESLGISTWQLFSAASTDSPSNSPKIDGTNNTSGNYIAIVKSVDVYEKKAILTSPSLPMTSEHCRMSFWAYRSSNYRMVDLQVKYYLKPYIERSLVININRLFVRRWTKFSPSVPSGPWNATISFMGLVVKKEDTIAIDEITFSDCNPKRHDIDCDFDDPYNTMCFWKQSSSENIKWYRRSQRQQTASGPPADHTTGSGYFLVVLSQARNTMMNSTLTSPIVVANAPEGDCFSMWYHMYGRDIGALLVETVSNGTTHLEWTKEGPQGNRWLSARIFVNSSVDFNFLIKAQTKSSLSNIAIDDIKLVSGSCHDAKFCDFEEDFCGWEAKHYGSIGWSREQGFTNSSILKPATDHTRETPEGYYLYLPITPDSEANEVLLTSPAFKNYGEMCLELWYDIADVQEGALEIFQISPNSQFEDSTKPIWRRIETPSSGWKRGRVTLKRRREFSVQIKGISGVNANNSFLAIDDLQFLDGACSDPTFCNFELDSCGWTNNRNYNSTFDWLRISSAAKTFSSSPLIDHTTKNFMGHYMYAPLAQKNVSASAFLISDEIATTQSEMCLRFWINLYNSGSSEFLIYHISPNKHTLDLGVSHSNKRNNFWLEEKINFPVTITKNMTFFNIGFNVKVFENFTRNTGRGIAIDDISLTNYGCRSTPPPTVSTTPMPTPRPSKFDCNFEANTCLWEPTEKSWIRQNGEWYGSFPKFDHTTMTTAGFYMTPDFRSSTTSILATVDTITIDWQSPKSCIKFWIYLYGTTKLSLEFNLFKPDDHIVAHRLWSRNVTQDPRWNYQQVEIQETGTFQMAFSADQHFGFNSHIGLDDISYNEGACPPTKVCTVEDDLCSFYDSIQSDIKWSIGSGKTTSNGPREDRTYQTDYGRYFFIDGNKVEKVNSTAVLESDNFEKDMTCIRFWYYFSGNKVGIFRVRSVIGSVNSVLWEVSEDEGEEWHFGQVSVVPEPPISFKYTFEAVTGVAIRDGIIALDNIQISYSCPPPGSCNFDEELCSWYNDLSSDSLFQRCNGQLDRLCGPSIDHTFGTNYGIYLYVNNKNMYGGRSKARLLSPFLPSNREKCISFWSNLNGTITSPTITLLLSHIATNTSSVLDQILPQQQEKGAWVQRQVPIKYTFPTGKYQLSIETVLTSDQSVALDDIFITDYPCKKTFPENGEFKCDNNVTSIKMNQLCDFVQDCMDGADEHNCGTKCNFESNSCNWKNSSGYANWIRTTGESVGNPSQPKTDHTLNAENGFYLLFYSVYYYENTAELVSPRYSRSYSSCILSFWFYMNTTFYGQQLGVTFKEENIKTKSRAFRLTKGQPAEWQHGEAVIGRINGPFTVSIYALSINASTAIDDLLFENCGLPKNNTDCNNTEYTCKNQRCISEDFLCDYNDDCGDFSDEDFHLANCRDSPGRCNFEDSFCEWTLAKDNEVTPTLLKRENLYGTSNGLPERDHTMNSYYGGYVYVKNNPSIYYNPKLIENKIGSLESPVMRSAGDTCKFRLYYMYETTYKHTRFEEHQDIGTLRIYTKQDAFGIHRLHRTLKTALGMFYERAVVDLSDIVNPFQVIVSVTTGKDNDGVWALDDFSFSKGCERVAEPLPNILTTTTAPTTPRDCDYKCSNGKCLNFDQICDFVAQCPDNSDEANCGACDFSNGTCGWEDNSLGRFMWKLYRPFGYSNMPNNDDSYLYVTTNPDGGVVFNKAVVETPGLRNSSSQCSVKFSYLLSTNGQADLQLFLTKPSSPIDELLWETVSSDRENNQWIEEYASIGRQSGTWGLKFTANLENEVSEVRLNKISYEDCAMPEAKECGINEFKCRDGVCINETLLCDFSPDCPDKSDEEKCESYTRCDFENGLCGWTAIEDQSSRSKWELHAGGNPNSLTGVGRDHTFGNASGNYMMTKGAIARDGDLARLESVKFEADVSQKCFIRLWYHIAGTHESDLVIKIREIGTSTENPIAPLEGVKGHFGWQRGETVLYNRKEFQVLIDGKAGRKGSGLVAIDDISFTPFCKISQIPTPSPTINPKGFCAKINEFECEDNMCLRFDRVCDFVYDCVGGADEASCPSVCDFEKNGDDCGWKPDKNNPEGFMWSITNGSNASVTTGPQKDKTKDSAEGHYMILHASSNTRPKNASVLIGPTFKPASTRCTLEFWYNYDSLETNTTLYLNSTDFKEPAILFRLRKPNPQSIMWLPAKIGLGQRHNPFNLFFEWKTENEYPSGLSFSLDDIVYMHCDIPKVSKSETPCRSDQYRCEKSRVCIKKTLQCDISDDCSDASDEKRCVDMNYVRNDFENGMGIFSPDIKDPSDMHSRKWMIGAGPYKLRLDENIGPPFDHTLSNVQGQYLYLNEDKSKYDDKSLLFTPVLRPTNLKNCSMRFFYYMHGPMTNELSVLTRNRLGFNASKQIWSKAGGSQDFWERDELDFTEKYPFQIILEGRSSGGNLSSIAIDDVTFTPGCTFYNGSLPYTRPDRVCEDNEFQCSFNSTCIPLVQQCDFRNDCEDGSDEFGCVEDYCPFETGTCGWKITKYSPKHSDNDGDFYMWRTISAKNFHGSAGKGGPETDVTLKTPNGHFLITESKYSQNYDDWTMLTTPTISRTGSHCDIEFWAFVNSWGWHLDLFFTNENETKAIWNRYMVLYNQWFKQRTFIGRQERFNVSFRSERLYNINSFVALDDLKFSNCEPPLRPASGCNSEEWKCHDGGCIDSSRLCDFVSDCDDGSDETFDTCQNYKARCDFEHGVCSEWNLETGGKLMWKLRTVRIVGIGLIGDHTTRTVNGHYLSVDGRVFPWDGEKQAQLSSYVIKATPKDCNVRFWYVDTGNDYNFHNPIEMKIYKRVSYNENGMKLLNILTLKNNDNFWERADIVLNKEDKTQDYQVVIEAYFNNSRGELYLDDISLTTFCDESSNKLPGQEEITTPVPTGCGLEQKFTCKNGNCYTHLQRCNFANDCGDFTDEEDCGTSCDFETGMCGWFNSPDYDSKWERKAASPQRDFPPTDHKGNKTGTYLKPNFHLAENVASLMSKSYVQSGSQCRFSLWYIYYSQSENKDTFTVVKKGLVTNTPKISTVISIQDKLERKWTQVSGLIGLDKQFQLTIISQTKNDKIYSHIAIDDFLFENCEPEQQDIECSQQEWGCRNQTQCIHIWERCDGKSDCKDKSDEVDCEPIMNPGDCNFDVANWTELCRWEELDNYDFYWTNSMDEGITLKSRTGSGYFLYIDGSKQENDDEAIVAAPLFKATTGVCHLNFWFYIRGEPIVNSTYMLEVFTLGNDNSYSTQLWHAIGDQGDQWLHAYLQVGSMNDYKVAFKGTSAKNAYFGLDDVRFSHGCIDGGETIRPPSPCIWYERQCGSGECLDQDFFCDCQEDCQDGSDEKDCAIACSTIVTSTTASTSTTSKVTTSTTATTPATVTSTTSKVTTSTTATTPATVCRNNEFKCTTVSKCVPLTQKCDFRNDCGDGSDELDCVEDFCSFETGVCGWNITKQNVNQDDKFVWKRTSAKDFIETTGNSEPKTDITLKTLDGHYLVAESQEGSYGDWTMITTPIISRTGGQCDVEFWVYATLGQQLRLLLTNKNETKPIWNNYQPYNPSWNRHRKFIGKQETFTVSFLAKRFNYKLTVAMDDIKFSNCEPPLRPASGCDSEEWKCHDGGCIDSTRLCDFASDCDDGSDETFDTCRNYKARCDFEHGVCNEWTLENTGVLKWILQSPQIIGVGLYEEDHTTRQLNGQFITAYVLHAPWQEGKQVRISSYVIKASQKECNVRFWYRGSIFATDTPYELRVYRRVSYYKKGMELLDTFPMQNSTDFWKRANIGLNKKNETPDYQVVVEAYFEKPTGQISLDDLSLTTYCDESSNKLPGQEEIITPVPTGCGLEEKFTCKNGNCYTHLQRCNFVNDCGDFTDEEDCGTSCNFESGMCGWFSQTREPDEDSVWQITSVASHDDENIPLEDHKGNKSGSFLMPRFKSYSKVAILMSKTYVKSATGCRFSLWYFYNTTYVDPFAVLKKRLPTVNPQVKTLINITKQEDSQSWKKISGDIGLDSDFHLIITTQQYNLGRSSPITIDDFAFEKCEPEQPDIECMRQEWSCHSRTQCIHVWQHCDGKPDCNDESDELDCQPIMNAGDCSFDNEDWVQVCKWEELKIHNFLWRNSFDGKANFNSRTSSGHFLYIDGSQQEYTDEAIVAAPIFKASSGLCHLNFWFYIRGESTINNTYMLEVLTLGNDNSYFAQLWHAIDNQGDKWLHAYLQVGSMREYKVAFKGTSAKNAYLGLDNVRFSPGCMDGGEPIIPATPHPCIWYELQCGSGECLDKDFFCDCQEDCKDGSDEKDCEGICSTIYSTTTNEPKPCKGGFKRCGTSDGCIPILLWCDGIPDCPNGEDESETCEKIDCEDRKYPCKDTNLQCLDENQICNGVKECSDGSDESICYDPTLSDIMKKYCQNGGDFKATDTGLPQCTCTEGYSGNRCSKKITAKPTLDNNKGWIAGVVIGVLLLVAILVVVWFEYRKRRRTIMNSPHSIDNPVYGLQLETRVSNEDIIDLQQTTSSSSSIQSVTNPTSLVNPLYESSA